MSDPAWEIWHHYDRTTGGEFWFVARGSLRDREVIQNAAGRMKRFRSRETAERALRGATPSPLTEKGKG